MPRRAGRLSRQPPIVEKAPDARTVLVVGDFMATGLAEGLDTAFAENTKVRIVVRSNGSSGFARDDFYNWPEQIKPLIEAEKPAGNAIHGRRLFASISGLICSGQL